MCEIHFIGHRQDSQFITVITIITVSRQNSNNFVSFVLSSSNAAVDRSALPHSYWCASLKQAGAITAILKYDFIVRLWLTGRVTCNTALSPELRMNSIRLDISYWDLELHPVRSKHMRFKIKKISSKNTVRLPSTCFYY